MATQEMRSCGLFTRIRAGMLKSDSHVAAMVFPDGKTDVTVESGHPMLKQAAIESAKQSRFEFRQCDAAVSYKLVYSLGSSLLRMEELFEHLQILAKTTSVPERQRVAWARRLRVAFSFRVLR